MAEWVEKGSIKGPPGEIPDVSDFLRDSDVSPSISGSSDKVASDKAVKDYVDSQVSAEATARQELEQEVSGKADAEHTHEMSGVTGLNDKISEIKTSIEGKANSVHTHAISDVTSLQTSLDGKASIEHSHDMEDVTGLDTALSSKSDTGHKHTSTDITDFTEKMAQKADTSHNHEVEDVTGLQTILDGKAASVHTHTIENVTGLQGELDGKADDSHTHVSADVTDLQEKLNAKANTTHEHTISNVTGLQTALDTKADDEHTHTSEDITNFNDAVSAQIPMTLPNDFALNMNIGEESVSYDGSSYQSVDITAEAIGAAEDNHKHSASDITSGTFNIARIPTITDAKIDSVSATKLTGTIPQSNLPSYVDDVLEYAGVGTFPEDGEAGKIYVDTTTNKTYRWGGSSYVEISASLALGETSSTAYRGDYGKVAYTHATAKGSAFASGLYKITTNAQGHVTAATAVTKTDITALGIPAQDTNTTYQNATTSADGLMSSEDKTKLDGIASGANKYTHPSSAAGAKSNGLYKITTDANGHITAATAVTKTDITDLGIPAQDTNTTYSNMKGASASEAGAAGLVPAPSTGAANRYLRSDGTWAVPPDTNTTYTLSSFGITATAAELNKLDGVTATAAELNYVDGVTSNIQTQLNGKAASSHTHQYAGSASAGGSANSAVKLDTSAGSATQPVYFSGGKPIATTYTLGTSVPSGAKFTDTTYSVMKGATSNAAGGTGLVPAPAAGKHTSFLRGDGTWVVPTNTTYSNMSGASSSAAGKAGLVPAPSAGAANRYLRSDGTWAVPPDTNTTYNAATTSSAGLMSAADKTKLDGIATGANKYTLPVAGTALGGIKTDYVTSGKNYAVKVDSDGSAYVNVPWTDTNTTYTLSSFGITATAAELNYVDGVTSNIQTQLNGKAASSHTHAATQVTGFTASRALVSDSSGHPAVSAVTSTELGYLDGVTSAIQTQLNNKAAISHSHSAATTSAAGFMNAADKTKLNGLNVASDTDFKTYMGIA